jgi:hypothetical protein
MFCCIVRSIFLGVILVLTVMNEGCIDKRYKSAQELTSSPSELFHAISSSIILTIRIQPFLAKSFLESII